MSVERIASRYAKSLLDLAKEENRLERVKNDIASFSAATENRDFYLMLKSPVINPEKKISIFQALFGEKFDELTLKFVNLLATKSRESYLPEVADEFMKQYRTLNQILKAKVTTATPVGESTLNAVRQKILDGNPSIKEVELEVAVDPSLIGGLVIEYGDKIYDASIAHKLSKLKSTLGDNSFVSAM